jgi:TetR/AcrR family transcriptional repressor of lmrAB and yxaGH operons
MTKGNDAKKRAIAAATNLFRRKGYHGTGLTEILKASNAPKGSFYFHFPDGKEQLAAQTLHAAARDTDQTLGLIAARTNNTADYVEAVAAAFGRILERSNFEASCPIANVSVDMSAESKAIAQEARDGFRAWHKSIAEALEREIPNKRDASEMAATILAALEGALILCRAEKSLQPLEAVTRQLKVLVSPKNG